MIKQISIIVFGTVLTISILNYSDVVSADFFISSLIAGSMTLVSAFSAFFFFRKSLGKSNNEFLLYNLGGMGLRLLFLLVIVIIVIKFLNIDEYAFIFLFFIFYFISLIFEVNYFRKKIKEHGKSK